LADREFWEQEGEVQCGHKDEQEVTRSRLPDGKILRQRGGRISVVAMEAAEREFTRSRLVDGGDFGAEMGKVLCG
jgi:hypothetical protein